VPYHLVLVIYYTANYVYYTAISNRARAVGGAFG
jgi:hypothetical protein